MSPGSLPSVGATALNAFDPRVFHAESPTPSGTRPAAARGPTHRRTDAPSVRATPASSDPPVSDVPRVRARSIRSRPETLDAHRNPRFRAARLRSHDQRSGCSLEPRSDSFRTLRRQLSTPRAGAGGSRHGPFRAFLMCSLTPSWVVSTLARPVGCSHDSARTSTTHLACTLRPKWRSLY